MHRTLEHSVDVKVASSPSLPLIAPSASAGALSGIARGSRQRCRSHVACQTNVTELAELSTLQASLRAVREELRVVTFELGRAEQKMRHEMRNELEMRLRAQEMRCMERVSYMKRRAERHVSQVRAAARTKVQTQTTRHRNQLTEEMEEMEAHAEEVKAHAQETFERSTLKEAAQRHLEDENRVLLAQISELKAQSQARSRVLPSRLRATVCACTHTRSRMIASARLLAGLRSLAARGCGRVARPDHLGPAPATRRAGADAQHQRAQPDGRADR